MTVKFRIAFDIDSPILFEIFSKLFPVDNLSVSEIRRPVEPTPDFEPPKKIAPKKKKRPSGIQRDLAKGANAVIMGVLADRQPHPTSEVKQALAAATYARNGAGSTLAKLRAAGIIVQSEIGMWQLVEKTNGQG